MLSFSPKAPSNRASQLVALVFAGLVIGGAAPASAEDYRAALQRLVEGHKRIAGAAAEVRASEAEAARARSGWYPTLTASANLGRNTVRTSAGGTPESELGERELSLTLKQPLWDFGKIGGEVDKAGIGVERSRTTLNQTAQDLLLEGLIAYINLRRSGQDLEFARQSVANIRRQTGLEESRVSLGGGVTSDVLQVKSQLAGAEARLIRAEGAVIAAANRFRALFAREPAAEDRGQKILPPVEALPKSLDAAMATALDHNNQLAVLRLNRDSARAEYQRVRGSKLYPEISGVAETRTLHNPSGLRGDRTEALVKLEMTYPFNTGLEAFHASDAAREAIAVADTRLAETTDLVEEQVRNAWQALATARANAERLDNQARIVGEFLRLAREERVQGKRSLIDILSGETSLINARSDAASAQADIAVAAFTLLKTTGRIELPILR
ncbi:MAG: outer membrane efflux protein [Azospirillum sp.]|nr:outer membrane efflux protein [Azospirillum sp.]